MEWSNREQLGSRRRRDPSDLFRDIKYTFDLYLSRNVAGSSDIVYNFARVADIYTVYGIKWASVMKY